MIRAVNYQKLDMTDDEFDYYQKLVVSFTTTAGSGTKYFEDLFVSNDSGKIVLLSPKKPLPWEIMFFLQNLMINQQMRDLDARLNKIELHLGV
jgi:hypothetical protein